MIFIFARGGIFTPERFINIQGCNHSSEVLFKVGGILFGVCNVLGDISFVSGFKGSGLCVFVGAETLVKGRVSEIPINPSSRALEMSEKFYMMLYVKIIFIRNATERIV